MSRGVVEIFDVMLVVVHVTSAQVALEVVAASQSSRAGCSGATLAASLSC